MKEYEIRPKKLYTKYLELVEKDVLKSFENGSARETISCVACGAVENAKHEFYKNGFEYQSCKKCQTLFLNPRPSLEQFENFYRYSDSSKYWATVFYPAIAEVRREKIFQKRVLDLKKFACEYSLEINSIIDVGAGYGIFLEEWLAQNPKNQLLAIEPSVELANVCRDKHIPVIQTTLEDAEIDKVADLVTCFEVLEHVFNPLQFLQKMVSLVKPGGLVFISTLGIDGFDLQILWNKSKQISPPYHINFMSTVGFELLFKMAGLENVKLITPGQLDVDIVFNAIKEDDAVLAHDRFLRGYMNDEGSRLALQDFLVRTKRSSHVWIMGQKCLD